MTNHAGLPVPDAAPPDEEAAPAKERGLMHYLGVGLSGAVLVIVLALAALVIVIPKIAGGIPLTVLTSSMIPHYPPGTLVIDVPVHPNDLKIGDVATYQISSGKPGVITHRIVAIHSASNGKRTFQFKGDNNSVADPNEILAAQIQGRVWYSIPLLGYVENAVNGQGKSWLIPVLASLLFIYAGYTITTGIVSARRKRRAG